MDRIQFWLVLFLIPLMATLSFASVPPKNHWFQAPTPYFTKGAVAGGKAGRTVQILSIQHFAAKKLTKERVIFQFADSKGKMLRGQMGYFHLQHDAQRKTLSLDFSQMKRSLVNSSKLKKILSQSQFIGESRIHVDPTDHSTNLTLQFRRPLKIKVRRVKMKGGDERLVLDFKVASSIGSQK